MCECDVVGEGVLAGLKCVQFGLSPVEIRKLDMRDGAFVTLAHIVVEALHELVQLGDEVGEVGDALLDPLEGTDELLQVGPSGR